MAAVAAALELESETTIHAALRSYADLGQRFQLYPALPLAANAGRAFVAALISKWEISGGEHLRQASNRGPVFILSSHLSYADSQFTDAALVASLGSEFADRLVFVAGPKVYEDPFRRMAAAGLNTLKTAQSARLAHNEADLSPLQVARVAIATVKHARELAAGGQFPLLYGEGSRSRDGRLSSFLRGIARYPQPGALLIPFALSGTERAFPVHQPYLFDSPIRLRIGPAVEVIGKNALPALEEAWHRIAAMSPPEYQPAPDTPPLR
jgi:1-acyl-sn-glycerol-3-phosphate acyltransferase